MFTIKLPADRLKAGNGMEYNRIDLCKIWLVNAQNMARETINKIFISNFFSSIWQDSGVQLHKMKHFFKSWPAIICKMKKLWSSESQRLPTSIVCLFFTFISTFILLPHKKTLEAL